MDFGKLFSKIVDVVKENIETATKATAQPTQQPKPTTQPTKSLHFNGCESDSRRVPAQRGT